MVEHAFQPERQNVLGTEQVVIGEAQLIDVQIDSIFDAVQSVQSALFGQNVIRKIVQIKRFSV